MTEHRQQRRLATILAADVFGYSRLMAENEEDALATLKAHRGVIDRLIVRHEGRVFNTAGDSVLAEFNSAVEAVRCAITIQEELRVRNTQMGENRRMELRIGINVGDVLVDAENLYGDGVNIAARLESIAAPGSICISGSVFSLVKNKLSYGFEDIGLQTVKNIPEPVPVFRLTASVSTPQAGQLRKRLMIASAVVAVLLIVAAGGWAYNASILGGFKLTPPSKVQTEASSVRLGTAVSDARPSDAGNAFNGIWEFTLSGGKNCHIKSLTFPRRISEGVITGLNGARIGSIAKDGSFHFANPSPQFKGIIVESQGTIKGETGEGSYAVLGSSCRGSYRIRLVRKLNR
jgi:class 3 adenylate cyclase